MWGGGGGGGGVCVGVPFIRAGRHSNAKQAHDGRGQSGLIVARRENAPGTSGA